MTIQEALATTSHHLKHLYSPETVSSIALWILEWVTGYDHTTLIARVHEQLGPKEYACLQKALKEHVHEHKPLPYIFGTVPFLALNLTIEPPLLIPRSETEYWCSWLIETSKKEGTIPSTISGTILDLCCGSGCIGLSLAQAFPQSIVYAVDDSPLACTITQENAKKNEISSVHCLQSNLYEALPPTQKFDLIVSNPPYISIDEWHSLDPSVARWEDPHALIAQNNGLALIAAIIDQAPLWLSPTPLYKDSPQLVIECGYNQGAQVKSLCEKAGFFSVEVRKDPAGNDRFITARWRSRA